MNIYAWNHTLIMIPYASKIKAFEINLHFSKDKLYYFIIYINYKIIKQVYNIK